METYKLVPLTAWVFRAPCFRPMGSVATPKTPNHTMTSYLASVELTALFGSESKNMSMATFELTSAARRSLTLVVLGLTSPTP